MLALLARPVAASEERVILIIGDSLSAAYQMAMSESWPRLLQDRLVQDGYGFRVFNSSIVGDTTEGGLSRLPRLLADLQPAVVVIELGGNDGLRGLSLEVTHGNLAAMIEQSQAAGAAVVLAGVHLPPNYGQTYTERFSAMFRSLAEEHPGIGFVPFILEGVALDPVLMQEDGIHPAAAAQPLLLDNVWPALKPLLQRPAAAAAPAVSH